jgi:hypothetical protein
MVLVGDKFIILSGRRVSFGTTFGGVNVLFNFAYLTLFISVSSKMHLET